MSSSPSTQPLPEATASTDDISGSKDISEPRRDRGQRADKPGGASDSSSRNDSRRQRQNTGQRRWNNSRAQGRIQRFLASSAEVNSEPDATSLHPESVQLETPPASTHSQPNNNYRRSPHTARGRSANHQGQDSSTGQRRRAARFNPALSKAPEGVSRQTGSPPKGSDGNPSRKRTRAPPGDDLTSILTFALSNLPYPECMICFNPILPGHPSWSCSPKEDKDAQSCWNTFHLKCIKPWAEKSVKDTEDAWRARGEERKGEWRCPGCQSKREIVPRKYR